MSSQGSSTLPAGHEHEQIGPGSTLSSGSCTLPLPVGRDHGEIGIGGTLPSGSWLPELSDLSPTVKQTGVVNRIRVHSSAQSVSRSRGQTKKDALTPNARPFHAGNDAGPWRTSAKDDLAAVAAAFGADLGSVVAPDISYEEAQAMLRESSVTLPGFDESIRECGLSVLEASQFQFWEFSQDLAMPQLLFWKSMSTRWPLATWCSRPLAALQLWAHPLT